MFVIRQHFLLNIPTVREHVLCITSLWQTKPFSCHMHCYFQTFYTWCTHKVCRLVKIAVYIVEQSFNLSSYLFTVTYICCKSCQNEDQSSSVTKSIYFYLKFDHRQLWISVNGRKTGKRKKRHWAKSQTNCKHKMFL